MQWVVLFFFSAAAATLACLTAALLARALSFLPWAGLRKWVVILCALALVLPVAWLVIVAVYFSDEYRDLWRIVTQNYQALPSFTLLLAVPAATAALFFLGALASGFRPEPFLPYQPRAAYWSLRSISSWFGFMAALVAAALVAQDFELRRALRERETEAEAMARKLAPEPVAEADNAAVHYQRVVEMMDGIDKWREEQRFDDVDELLLRCDIDDEKFEEYFQRLEPMFEQLRLAAERPECRFDDKYMPLHIIDGMEARYALISAMRLVRQLSNYRTCQGRPAEAIACLVQMRHFVDHLAADPRAREGVFYYWCESWIRQGVEHLVTHSDALPAEELRGLISAEPLPTETLFREGIQWHAAAIQKHLVNIYGGAEFERKEFRFDQAFGKDRDKRMPRWLLLAGMRATTARDEMAAVQATFPFTTQPDDEGAWTPRWDDASPSGVLTSSALSSSYLPYWIDRGEANRRMTNIAVAAALYQHDEGQWPESFDQLAPKYLPEIPRPGDGEEPFRLRSIENGLMAYSAELDEQFEKFEDKQAWWEEAGDFVHYGYCLFLGRAREWLVEFQRP